MSRIELIYDDGCPNANRTRERLSRAFAERGIPAQWKEWERGNPSAPAYVRFYGSPTILIDGKDVADAEPVENVSSCRIYAGTSGGYEGTPSTEMIAAALRASHKTAAR